MGRVFTVKDERRGRGEPGLVISHGFWQREYGGDLSVIGRRLAVADRPLEIAVVTPPDFFGMEVGRSFEQTGNGVGTKNS